MTTLEIVQSTINQSSLDDLKSISDLIKMRRDQLSQETMRELVVGDKVEFESRKNNKIQGTIVKKNIKRLVVSTNEGRWNVPASLLTKVEDWS